MNRRPPNQYDGFIFDVENWFGSVATQRMSFAEKGVFLVMLFQEWREATKTLPDDVEAIADLIAVTPEQRAEVLAAWETVRRKFVVDRRTPVGRMFNVKLERTRRAQRAKILKKSSDGRKAGKASASKRIDDKEVNPQRPLTGVERSSTSSVMECHDLNVQHTPRVGHRRHAYCPPKGHDGFCVPEFLHAEFVTQLGLQAPDFDLLGWYVRTDDQRRASGEAVDRPLEWWRAAFRRTLRAEGITQPPVRQATPPANRPQWQPFECPHEPKCTEGRWRCEQRTALESARKAVG